MSNFVFRLETPRVVFGVDTVNSISEELRRLDVKLAVILCTPQQTDLAERVTGLIGDVGAGTFSQATMHTPTHITEQAISYVKMQKAACVISVGGGSTIGLGKAISVRTQLPHICIPTTYAGSEMSPILGETENGVKTTKRDPAVLPTTVIYDVALTKTLPASMSATSGVNAIAHAVEALYAWNANPIIDFLAIEGIKALSEALPVLMTSPSDDGARYKALYGSWLCGTCLGNADMALHHKLCHTLGGSFNLPHAETHTIVLPHALSYNAPAISIAMAKLAKALPDSHGDAVQGLNALLDKLKVKRALAQFGMKEEDVEKATKMATSNPYKNPRTIEYQGLRECIRRAWAGEFASSDGI